MPDNPPAADSLLGLYAQPDLVLARGAGCRVWDEEGNAYLDFTAGIAVNALGHGAPPVVDAIHDALSHGLIHTSNLYRTRPARELADLLVAQSFPGGVFFCNSGAEANEAAFKFARRWAHTVHGPDRFEILAFHGAFHGRLFGSLAATDRPAYQEPFRPLMPGVHFADIGDGATVANLLGTGAVAAVIVEVVQGEGGVRPTPGPFLAELRRLCDAHDVLLIFDEIQCGLGRTGRAFAWQHHGVVPDLMTLAKPLAGGLPMGAVVVSDRVAATLRPGDHATTFGGGPLVASVALAVTRTLTEPAFLERVETLGLHLATRLTELRDRHASVTDVRGLGLMRGMALDGAAAPVVARARDLGLLVVSAGPSVVRIVPPLTISAEELDEGMDILDRALS
ncbi:MAG: acetylornithine/succinylornithine family transaminase [Gemmatimonadota bacterium]|jgi:predicted acetylornithine/succinylornithine family transaminase